MSSARQLWAGIDWSTTHHDLAVISPTEPVLQLRVPHTTDGLTQLIDALAGVHRMWRRIPIGIETNDGLLVTFLRQHGARIVPIPPQQAHAHRTRHGNPGRKSDRGDAVLLAHVVATAPCRPAPDITPAVRAIRTAVRAQRRTSHNARLHTSQLRAHLTTYFPAVAVAWPGRSALQRPAPRLILRIAPSPAAARRLTVRRLERLLERSGRVRGVAGEAVRLHEVFHAPALHEHAEVTAASAAITGALLDQIATALDAGDRLQQHTNRLFDSHPHAPIYTSFPGLGPHLAPRLLGELGDDLTRFATARALRAYAGAAPLTWASGSHTRIRHRRHTNTILAETGHLWAYASLRASPGARALYDQRKAAGDRHAAALRRVYSRFLGQLHHCLAHQITYDEHAAWYGRDSDAS
ncbi:IS110 family transposase [Catenuloplanes japonicus]|uniref:IS110 family transposase n=1 Tax=Catenuloplanes japonicus TaxID=33876 RepID=UPI0005253A76|nr:IS110 family transposase [Catenuloplanes japonicus]